MADLEERGNDIDVERLLSRVERKGPLTFTKKRCLYRAPEFVKRLSGEETVNEGSSISFTCKVVAFPNPTLSLYKDGEQLTDNSRITIEQGEGQGEYNLVLRNAKKSDEASYRCKAANAEGSSTSTIYIAVKAKARSSKKSLCRAAAFLKIFPPITENAEEEAREAEESKSLPESPLSGLLYSLSWKNRTWPQFLGSWAFVNGVSDQDFDDIGDDIDDEDVFLSDESDSDFDDNRKNKPDGVDDFYDSLQHTDAQPPNKCKNGGITIPNLVFENKNLTKNEGKSEVTFFTTDRPLKLVRDVNANKPMINHETDLNCQNDSDWRADSDFVCENSSHWMSEYDRNGCRNSTVCSDSKISSSNRINNDKKTKSHTLCSASTSNWHERDDVRGNLGEIALLISCSTLMSLYYDITPGVFCLTTLIGQFLYCLIRFMLRFQ